MPQILVQDLAKTYRVAERDPGVLGAMRGLVHRRWRTVQALTDVSFSLERGELLGFMGPNGAGKSTTIKILSGILRPDGGRVEVDGLVPRQDRIRHVAQIGVVFGQPTQLWWDLPVGDAFDRILLRPRSATLQLMGHEFRLSRIGRFAQGGVMVAVATAILPVHWDAGRIALAVWTVAGGVALFFGLLALQATLAFWTVESLEVMNALTYGGIQAVQFPLSLYAGWFRNFLIFVVPLGCVAYFPVLAILGRPDPLGAPGWVLPLTPLGGWVFLGVSFAAWGVGVGKYTSTGS